MATDDHGEVYSDLAIPPGETLADEIAARRMSQMELAARLGRPVQAVNEVIHGKKVITDDLALGLEKVLGIPAGFWFIQPRPLRVRNKLSTIRSRSFKTRSGKCGSSPTLVRRLTCRRPR